MTTLTATDSAMKVFTPDVIKPPLGTDDAADLVVRWWDYLTANGRDDISYDEMRRDIQTVLNNFTSPGYLRGLGK